MSGLLSRAAIGGARDLVEAERLLLGGMLQKLGPDPDGAGRDSRLHEEHRKAEADRDHRGDEKQRDRGAEVSVGQARREQ